MKKYLFLLILPLMIFIPKDVFAAQPTTNGYSCIYDSSSSQCSSLVERTIRNQQTISPNFSGYLGFNPGNYLTIDLYNQSFCPNESGGTWTAWIFSNYAIMPYFDVSVLANGSPAVVSQSVTDSGHGLVLNLTIPTSFSDGTITINLVAKDVIDMADLQFGISTYTSGTQTCSLGTSNIISSANQNTENIINNNNENSQNIINSSNQNSQNIIDNQNQNSQDVINNQNQNTENTINNQNENTDKIIQSNEQTQEVIKDQFQDCRDSYNLFNYINAFFKNSGGLTSTINDDGSVTVTGVPIGNYFGIARIDITDILEDGETYTISQKNATNKLYMQINIKNKNTGLVSYVALNSNTLNSKSFKVDKNTNIYGLVVQTNSMAIWGDESLTITNFYQLEKGSSASKFEPYGKKICTNKMDETNSKLDEAENTRKGILGTIKEVLTGIIELPKKLVNLLINALKDLFIPSDDYFTTKFNELKDNFNNVLGFLAYPFELITRTFNFLVNFEDKGSYVIKWNDVTVPNFEEHVIIKGGSFDLGTLLENNKVSSLRNIAFVFINGLLLLAFLQLCHNKYNEMFGGEISTVEYITVADTYDVDYSTGEVGRGRHVEKKTTRRKIE